MLIAIMLSDFMLSIVMLSVVMLDICLYHCYYKFSTYRGTYNPLEILAERENIYRLLSQTADGGAGNLVQLL